MTQDTLPVSLIRTLKDVALIFASARVPTSLLDAIKSCGHPLEVRPFQTPI